MGIPQDVRFGLRVLLKNPGFTSIAVLALALGIGANAAIFSIIYAALLAPLPYPEPDQLVMVWSRTQGQRNAVSAGDYEDWKRRNTVFRALHAFTGRTVNASTSDRPEQLQASFVTPGFIGTMGMPLALGRDFLPEEGQPGRAYAAVLTHRLWREQFGGDPGIVGRRIRIDARPHVVVGVLAPGLADRGPARLFIPLSFTPDQINHDFRWLLVMGRLKPGTTLAQATANMEAVTRRLALEYPRSNQGWAASVEPFKNNFLTEDTREALWFMLGAVGFVLLIACANVANLLLARGATRRREIAVRASLGAGRARIYRQFITESLLVAGMGCVLGMAQAWGLLKVILATMPADALPIEAEIRMNMPVLLFTVLTSGLSGLLFGCAPAWQATRSQVTEMLKEGGRAGVGASRHRLGRALVAAEFALALTLLAGSALAIRGLRALLAADLGFRTDHLLTCDLPVPDGRLSGHGDIETFYRQLLERIQAVPGVSSAAVSTGMPVRGTHFAVPFSIAEAPAGDASRRPSAGFNMVTPSYFATFGIEIRRGRAFSDRDRAGGLPVAIVNDTFAQRYLKNIDPLAQRIATEQLIPGVTRFGPPIEWQIVGVYDNVRNAGPQGIGFPEIQVPFWQSPWPATVLAVRTAGEPTDLQKSIAAIVQSLDPDLPLANVRSMDQVVRDSLSGARFGSGLLAGFSAIALLLAALGIYGVMSFSVTQRTHEIGVRMALGARRGRVVREVLRDGLQPATAGLIVGAGGAYTVARTMRSLWTAVEPMDPVAFGGATVALLVAAVLACLVPAHRAASVEPMTALRDE